MFISKVVDSSSIPESGKTKDFNIGIHSYPNWRSELNGQCEELR